MENTASTQCPSGYQSGSGYCMIELNGEEVMAQQSLMGANMINVINLGYVELKEGINTVTIHNTKDINGNLGHGRRSICLNNITFGKVDTADGPLDSLKLDFKAFAKKAATTSWWNTIGDTMVEDVKYFGCTSRTAPVSAESSAAYAEMLAYLKQEECWTINEAQSKFAETNAIKRFLLDNSENACGLRFYPAWFAGQNAANPTYSQLVLDVQVPLGAAGWYEMNLDVLHENPTTDIAMPMTGLAAGSGYGSIYVNGELVWENFDFASRSGRNYRKVHNLGEVWLEAGTNTIAIDLTKDFLGGGSNARRTINLCAMEFKACGRH